MGIRPLVRSGDATNTAALSRDHTIHIDASGLLTITGGKWTTYRNMAEDAVNQAATLARLPERACATRTLNIHGFHASAAKFGPLSVYGSDALAIQELIARRTRRSASRSIPRSPTAGPRSSGRRATRWPARVEDVLARRTRALFLNAPAAIEMAPRVAELLARELGRDAAWRGAQVKAFRELAAGYRLSA